MEDAKEDVVVGTTDPSLSKLELTNPSLACDELHRGNFSLWSTIGVNYSLLGTPLSIGTYLAFSIGVGGSPGFIYGYYVALIFQIFVCASLAEMSSALPHASGQVYWAAVFAPKSWARSLSYWTASFTAAAWFFWVVGCYLFFAQLLFATVSVCFPELLVQPYHVYLAFIGAAVVSILINWPLFWIYDGILKISIFWFNAETLIMLVALLVRSSPKQSARAVFVEFVNETGWSSDGLVFFLGLLPGITAVNGFDSSAHLADELPNPAVNVPKVMMGTAVAAGLAGVPMVIIYMLCVTNAANLLAPVGGQPIVQLFVDSFDLLPLTVGVMVVYIIAYLIGCCAILTTSSRVFWSFAHQSLLPFSGFLRKTRKPANQLPVNAIITVAVLACLIGLLNLGPATALNAILGSAAICFFISYAIPVACLLSSRRAAMEQSHYFNLGKAGYFINWVALCWMLIMSVFLCIPQYLPVTTDNMNYTVAVVGIVVICFTLNWLFKAKKDYQVPKSSSYDGPLGSVEAS